MVALFGSFWEEKSMIIVRVLDRDNRPVDGIAVTITSTYHNQDTATATTNQEGIAKFKLHPNEYSVFIDGTLFKTSYLGFDGNTMLLK